MRRVGVVMAVAGLLMGSTTMAVAQDAASDDGTEPQVLDVPDAGVEISLPAA